MHDNQIFYCPYCMDQNFCPFFNDQIKGYENYDEMRNFNNYEGNNEIEDLNLFYNQYYLDYNRASEQDINRILNLLSNNQPQLFNAFQGIIENYFRTVIAFTLDNSQGYTGNINQRVNNIFNAFRRRYNSIFVALSNSGIPNNVINRTFRSIIEFILRNISKPPVPTPTPGSQWSGWDGVLNFSPAVSWRSNRTDVFVKGTNNAL